jgi:hypothetical protein
MHIASNPKQNQRLPDSDRHAHACGGRNRAPPGSVEHGLGAQLEYQPGPDALARRAAIHRTLPGDDHSLLGS